MKGPPSDYLAFEYGGRPGVTIAQYPPPGQGITVESMVNDDKIERVDLLKIVDVVNMVYEVVMVRA